MNAIRRKFRKAGELGRNFFLIIFLTLSKASGQADEFIAVGTGTGSDFYPFSIQYAGVPSMRYQQVYEASQFSAIAAGGGNVSALYFQLGPQSPGFGNFLDPITNIQISLSTTSKSPDGLSTVFADNVGANDTTVFSGTLTLNAQPGAHPPFNLVISLQTPFYYNPNSGNLLLDIRNYTGGTTSPFNLPTVEVASAPGDAISIVYATSVGSPSGTTDTFGLVTGFDFAPIPEPSSLALLLAAGSVFWSFARWRKSQRNRPVGEGLFEE